MRLNAIEVLYLNKTVDLSVNNQPVCIFISITKTHSRLKNIIRDRRYASRGLSASRCVDILIVSWLNAVIWSVVKRDMMCTGAQARRRGRAAGAAARRVRSAPPATTAPRRAPPSRRQVSVGGARPYVRVASRAGASCSRSLYRSPRASMNALSFRRPAAGSANLIDATSKRANDLNVTAEPLALRTSKRSHPVRGPPGAARALRRLCASTSSR